MVGLDITDVEVREKVLIGWLLKSPHLTASWGKTLFIVIFSMFSTCEINRT